MNWFVAAYLAAHCIFIFTGVPDAWQMQRRWPAKVLVTAYAAATAVLLYAVIREAAQ